MTTFIASAAERNRQKRQLAEQAVKLAMQNQWQEAVDANRQIIELAPEEAEAWNRLGKALSEMGRYAEARDAYGETLKLDANNPIAQKQSKRLALLVEESHAGGATDKVKLDPRQLIEETGKTGIFELEKPAPAQVLARTAAGDEVYLKVAGATLQVENHRGEVLGALPARAALRLIELSNGGNRYIVGVTAVSERGIRVLVRETYQAPAMEGRVSFPSKGGPLPPELRAYTKDRALRFDIDEDDLLADDSDEELPEGEGEGDETTSDIEYFEGEESSDSSRTE